MKKKCDPGLAPMSSISYWHELSPREPTFNSGEVNLSSIGGGGEIATLRRWIDWIGQFGMRSLRPTLEPRNRRIPTTDRTPTGQFNVGADPGNFHDILKTLYVGSVNFTTYVRMSKWSRLSTLESELSRGRRHSVEDWTIGDAKKLKTLKFGKLWL